MDFITYKNNLLDVCGVDEAGRGPLAGPVVAAAVILPQGMIIPDLRDSKKISAKKRELLYDIIIENALKYNIQFGSIDEIEKYNILKTTHIIMNRCILKTNAKYALIDGNCMTDCPIDYECIVGGDDKICSISAASILAKVTRDRYMIEMDALYPEYHFAKHKGYGTRLHIEMILKYGPCPIHRPSFLTKILSR